MKTSRLTLVNLAIGLLLSASPISVQMIASQGVYDPWCDQDSDGDIDIYDIVPAASAYGTMGNAAKNVTIAGRVSKLAYSLENQSVGPVSYFNTGFIDVDGYAKVTICLYTDAVDNFYMLSTRRSGGVRDFVVDGQIISVRNLVKTYDVPNQQVLVFFSNNDLVTRYIYIDIYLTP